MSSVSDGEHAPMDITVFVLKVIARNSIPPGDGCLREVVDALGAESAEFQVLADSFPAEWVVQFLKGVIFLACW